MRAGDADRQQVVDRLRVAMDEGRLTLDEYDERVSKAYASQTYADLKELLTDLPSTTPVSRSQLAGVNPILHPQLDPMADKKRRRRDRDRRNIKKIWSGWAGMSFVLTGIWFLTELSDGFDELDFWPIWPIGIVALILIARTIAYVANRDD